MGARIPPCLHEKFSDYITKVDVTKSEVLTAALAQYLGATADVPLSQRVAGVELKVEELQRKFAVFEARVCAK
ncbi:MULTISPECIES: hypothetical protein [Moorena]|uniref:hypothetical protein n=1 Tax=Moorena TaxID=1155738 RepID=UPI0002E2CE37|nr:MULTISPECIES: hypothetical protein [Moorena]